MFFHKTGMLFLYVCFCHKHEEYNYEYCLFWQCFSLIYIGFFMFDAKELIQNSIPVLTKNIGSVLIPCFMLNHIKYMHSNFTMFGARSQAKLCLSQPNVLSNVLAPNIDQCLQWLVPPISTIGTCILTILSP